MGISIGESALVCYNHIDNQSGATERTTQPAVEITYVQALSVSSSMSYQGAAICLNKSPVV
jgi:hypothetical protein